MYTLKNNVIGTGQKVLRGVGWSSGLEQWAVKMGESFNFQLPIGVGHPVFILSGIGTHLTQSTAKVTPFSSEGRKLCKP